MRRLRLPPKQARLLYALVLVQAGALLLLVISLRDFVWFPALVALVVVIGLAGLMRRVGSAATGGNM